MRHACLIRRCLSLLALTALVIVSDCSGCARDSSPAALANPSTSDGAWAVALERPGLPNLHKVSDGLYRGAQPTAEGFRELSEMGIKTVVNLRSFHSDGDLLNDLPLAYEHIYFKAWHSEDEDVIQFLLVVTDADRTPVFVHCQHGADRTGVMCAAYRIIVQGWSKEDAVREMTGGGFGFHPVWQNLVDYVNDLDVEKLRREAGISAPAE